MDNLLSANVYSSELGEFINEDHRRFAEILRDLKPTYSLQYIPKNARETEDDRLKPWRIIDAPEGYEPYIVRYMSEVEMNDPQGILAWLIEGDVVRHGAQNIVRSIEARENARKLMEYKRQQDDLDDRIDHAAFLATGGRNKLHTIKLGDGRKMER